jgi:hypothetical protein
MASAGALVPFVSERDQIAPCFEIDGGKIRTLKAPSEFYETLKVDRYVWVCGFMAGFLPDVEEYPPPPFYFSI